MKIPSVFGRSIGSFLALASATIGLGIGKPREMHGQFYQDGTTPQQGIDFASPFRGISAQLRIVAPGSSEGVRHTSATFLSNDTAITAAHNITQLLQYNPTIFIADGLNYVNNIENELPVVSVIFHPSVDIAFLQFAYPIPHHNPASHTDLLHNDIEIASAVVGQRLMAAGYGGFVSFIKVSLPQDGYLRAFDANVGSVQIELPTYQRIKFGSESAGMLLNGRGTVGSSGGAVIDLEGKLVGIMVTASLDNGPTGMTKHVCLSEPSIHDWINQNSESFEQSRSLIARDCREKRLHPMKKPFVLLPKYPFVYEGDDIPYQGDALVYHGDDGSITCIFCDALGD